MAIKVWAGIGATVLCFVMIAIFVSADNRPIPWWLGVTSVIGMWTISLIIIILFNFAATAEKMTGGGE